MKKKTLAILFVILAYLGFLTASIVLGSQQGLYFQGAFWRYTGDDIRSPGGDRIHRTDADSFDLYLGGNSLTAVKTALPDGGMRMDYSDGWAVEWSADEPFWFGFDDYIWGSEARLILTDAAAQGFRFAAAASEERSPIYDQNGNVVGEAVQILSADGVYLDSYETWPGKPQFSTPERTAVVLEDGAVIPEGDVVFMNEGGEYLVNSHNPGRLNMGIPSGYSSVDRRSLSHFLMRIAEGEIERRSETMDMQVFLSVLLYGAGALQLFLPQELAFFGARWRFKNEPELSESGRAAMLIGGGVIMVIAVIMLFIGF